MKAHFSLRSAALLLILSTVLLVSRGLQCATACSLRQCAPRQNSGCPHSKAPDSSRDTQLPCTQHHSLNTGFVLAPKAAVAADFPAIVLPPPSLALFFPSVAAMALPAPVDTGPPDLVPVAPLRI